MVMKISLHSVQMLGTQHAWSSMCSCCCSSTHRVLGLIYHCAVWDSSIKLLIHCLLLHYAKLLYLELVNLFIWNCLRFVPLAPCLLLKWYNCGSVDGIQIKMTGDHRVTSYTERLRIEEIGEPLKDGETRLCGKSKHHLVYLMLFLFW